MVDVQALHVAECRALLLACRNAKIVADRLSEETENSSRIKDCGWGIPVVECRKVVVGLSIVVGFKV